VTRKTPAAIRLKVARAELRGLRAAVVAGLPAAAAAVPPDGEVRAVTGWTVPRGPYNTIVQIVGSDGLVYERVWDKVSGEEWWETCSMRVKPRGTGLAIRAEAAAAKVTADGTPAVPLPRRGRPPRHSPAREAAP